MKISILGAEYEIVHLTALEDRRLYNCGGYIDTTIKRIVVEKYEPSIDNSIERTVADPDAICKIAARHEITHAFFAESGLWADSGLGENELLVDWIAQQLPKMVKAMREAGCLE